MLSRWTVSWQLSQNVWMSCNRCHPNWLYIHTGVYCILTLALHTDVYCILVFALHTGVYCLLVLAVYTGVGGGQLAMQLISDLCVLRTSWSSSTEFTSLEKLLMSLIPQEPKEPHEPQEFWVVWVVRRKGHIHSDKRVCEGLHWLNLISFEKKKKKFSKPCESGITWRSEVES